MDTPWVLLLAGFVVSVVSTPAGVSGAFLLVPFQTSVLGASSVSVTPTNLLFNVIATPVAIATYHRGGRLDSRLAAAIVAGSLPGVILGAWIRVTLLADPARFRVVVGAVLVVLAARLVFERRTSAESEADPSAGTRAAVVFASFVVGVIGGVYGIGGGAFLAPFLTLTTRRSIHALAGAALVGTFVTSLVGVVVFEVLSRIEGYTAAGPRWDVGLWLGLGGLAGGWLGARIQTRVPEHGLRLLLTVVVGALGAFYLLRPLLG